MIIPRAANTDGTASPVRTPDSGRPGFGLYGRWVLANALAEGVGLGLTGLVWAAAILSAGDGMIPTLLLAALAVLAGTFIEGTVVGTAQWLVLKGPMPSMRWRTWAFATGVGAFVAWTLGMVPSTALSPGESGGGSAAEPPLAAMLGLAFLMGLVLGPVLGFAQWIVLRRFVGRALLWMPANALAWAFGMVVIFAGIQLATEGGRAGPVLAGTLLGAGAVVGAVHGAALLAMLRSGGTTAK